MANPRPAPITPPIADSQLAAYQRQRRHARQLRIGALGLLLVIFALPHIPSPIMGFDWWALAHPALRTLATPLPPTPLDTPFVTLNPQPLLQWLVWLLALFLALVALTLLLHLVSLYAQRMHTPAQLRRYIRLAISASTPGKTADAVALLKSLHGMVEPINPLQPAATPLILTWTARPERKIQQGVSIAGPEPVITSVMKRLQGLAGGAQAHEVDDPLLAELLPGRVLCFAEVGLALSAELPIAMIGKEHTLLSALLPALAPQAGVLASSVRIALEPVADRRWRLAVLALRERLRRDLEADEQQALRAKAAGPAFRCRLLLLAVANDSEAGIAQLQTIGAALAGSAQGLGLKSQRLRAGPVMTLPATPSLCARMPHSWWRGGMASGVMIGIAIAFMPVPLTRGQPLLAWAIPLLVAGLPLLALAARWRSRSGRHLARRRAALLAGQLPPRNPRVVPIWWPWLGRVE